MREEGVILSETGNQTFKTCDRFAKDLRTAKSLSAGEVSGKKARMKTCIARMRGGEWVFFLGRTLII